MSKQSELRIEIANKKYILSWIGNSLSKKQLEEFKSQTNKEIQELENELESNNFRNMMQGTHGIDETRCAR